MRGIGQSKCAIKCLIQTEKNGKMEQQTDGWQILMQCPLLYRQETYRKLGLRKAGYPSLLGFCWAFRFQSSGKRTVTEIGNRHERRRKAPEISAFQQAVSAEKWFRGLDRIKTVSSDRRTSRKARIFRHFRGLYLIPTRCWRAAWRSRPVPRGWRGGPH